MNPTNVCMIPHEHCKRKYGINLSFIMMPHFIFIFVKNVIRKFRVYTTMIIAQPGYFVKSAIDISYIPESPAALPYAPDSRHKRTTGSDSCAGQCRADRYTSRSLWGREAYQVEKRIDKSCYTAAAISELSAPLIPARTTAHAENKRKHQRVILHLSCFHMMISSWQFTCDSFYVPFHYTIILPFHQSSLNRQISTAYSLYITLSSPIGEDSSFLYYANILRLRKLPLCNGCRGALWTEWHGAEDIIQRHVNVYFSFSATCSAHFDALACWNSRIRLQYFLAAPVTL